MTDRFPDRSSPAPRVRLPSKNPNPCCRKLGRNQCDLPESSEHWPVHFEEKSAESRCLTRPELHGWCPAMLPASGAMRRMPPRITLLPEGARAAVTPGGMDRMPPACENRLSQQARGIDRLSIILLGSIALQTPSDRLLLAVP